MALGIAATRGGVRTAQQATVPTAQAQAAREGAGRSNWFDLSQPSTWVLIYGSAAGLYLLGLYFGYGGTRGSVF